MDTRSKTTYTPEQLAEFDSMTRANIPLANFLADKYWCAGLLRGIATMSDARQEAYLALTEAVRGYNPSHPTANLGSYLAKCIERHLRLVSKSGGLIRTPPWTRSKKTLEKRPDIAALVERAKVLRLLSPLNDEEMNHACNARGWHERVEPSCQHDFTASLVLEELHAALKMLPADERAVIEARYGLMAQEGKLRREVAEQCNMSVESVRTRELRALRHLREMLN